MPGPLVGVKARAPFQDAPSTIPTAASSSSACRIGEIALAGLRIDAIALAKALECIHQRGGGRDGIPGAHRCAGIDAAEARGRVAVDHDVAAGLVHVLDPQRQRRRQVLFDVVVAEAQSLGVRIEQFRLLAVALAQQSAHHLQIDVDQRGEHTGIGDVLQQDAVAYAVEVLVHELGERHPNHRDIAALQSELRGQVES